jgi:hypothetical protein
VSNSTKVNFAQSLVAVLAGNIIYFLLMPHLPPVAQHVRKYDFGMVVDFGICVAIFALIKTFSNRGSRSRQQQR